MKQIIGGMLYILESEGKLIWCVLDTQKNYFAQNSDNENFYLIEAGDKLSVFEKDGNMRLWTGMILPDRTVAKFYDNITWVPSGISVERWAKFFEEQSLAILVKYGVKDENENKENN